MSEKWVKGSSTGFHFYQCIDSRNEAVRWRVFNEPQKSWIHFRQPGWYWYALDQSGPCDKQSEPVGPFSSAKAAQAACELAHKDIDSNEGR